MPEKANPPDFQCDPIRDPLLLPDFFIIKKARSKTTGFRG